MYNYISLFAWAIYNDATAMLFIPLTLPNCFSTACKVNSCFSVNEVYNYIDVYQRLTICFIHRAIYSISCASECLHQCWTWRIYKSSSVFTGRKYVQIEPICTALANQLIPSVHKGSKTCLYLHCHVVSSALTTLAGSFCIIMYLGSTWQV